MKTFGKSPSVIGRNTTMTIYTAELDTSHFSFRATALSVSEANAALIDGLNRHGAEYRLDAKWWAGFECDIVVVKTTIGGCLRDLQSI
jgi:hypothetical protein